MVKLGERDNNNFFLKKTTKENGFILIVYSLMYNMGIVYSFKRV